MEVQVTNSVPSGTTNIQPATYGQDYRVGSGFSMTQTESFFPFHQKIPIWFDLFSDTLPEGTEAFQITFFPLPSRISSDGSTVEALPTPQVLMQKVTVIIEDDDCKLQT